MMPDANDTAAMARLAVAAPGLLAALRLLVEMQQETALDRDDAYHAMFERHDLWAFARQSVNRATGAA